MPKRFNLRSKIEKILARFSKKDGAKKISSPFATGGGGTFFENKVQSSFVVLMLTGGICPCLRHPIKQIELQGRRDGYNTDDFIAHVESSDGTIKGKLLAQVRHSVSFTAKDKSFTDAIQAAWRDFKNPKNFNNSTDVIALISGPLSSSDIDHVRPIFELARHSAQAEEFFQKVIQGNFISSAARNKLKIFRSLLEEANEGQKISAEEFWSFLKGYHLLSYDFDVESGTALSFLHSLIAQFAVDDPHAVWTQVTDHVASSNQNAGTITIDSVPKAIRDFFSKQKIQMPQEFKAETPDAQNLSGDQGNAVMLATLLGSWNEKMDNDMDAAKKLIE